MHYSAPSLSIAWRVVWPAILSAKEERGRGGAKGAPSSRGCGSGRPPRSPASAAGRGVVGCSPAARRRAQRWRGRPAEAMAWSCHGSDDAIVITCITLLRKPAVCRFGLWSPYSICTPCQLQRHMATTAARGYSGVWIQRHAAKRHMATAAPVARARRAAAPRYRTR